MLISSSLGKFGTDEVFWIKNITANTAINGRAKKYCQQKQLSGFNHVCCMYYYTRHEIFLYRS
jgi:hypothetical protein